jgi:Ca2+-binding EF-hand superfamily protein
MTRFQSMLMDVGLKMDKQDYKHCFHYFDFKQDHTINREEFAFFISLTDYELDRVVDIMKERLWSVTQGASRIKHNRMLRDIYRIINRDGASILSTREIMALCARFNIFVTEEEARKLKKLMDCDGNDKVEEKDFLLFMKTNRSVAHRSAQRTKESTAVLRRWLLRGNSGTGDSRRAAR